MSDQGSRVKRYEYKPYGTMQINKTYPSTKKFINEELYTGHIQDGGTGFYYMNARYYEPDVARFLTPDTYTGNPYNPNTQNVYSYTGGNPVNFVDPTGHFIISATLITIGIAAASYITATMSAPDFQLDMYELSMDIEQEKWGMVAVDTAALILPGINAGTGKGIVKGVDNIISSGLGDDIIEAGGDFARNIDNMADAYGGLKYAGNYGVDSYKNLSKRLSGTGLEAHHVIEKRLAGALGIADSKLMNSVAVTAAEHRKFTNAWRQTIPYGTDYLSEVPKSRIWSAAQEIYKDYPELLEAARRTIFD